MQKKFALTNETRVFNHKTLYRIKALKDFSDVKAGQLGGFIESEDNLSHDGNCWVYDNALVLNPAHIYENAKVFNNAIIMGTVYGNAKLSGNARIYSNAVVYDHAVISGAAKIYGKVYGKASVGGYTQVYGSVYGNAKVTGYHTIRGLVHGNARLKRDGYSYVKQNFYYAYGIPEDCEIYENDTVVKISENKAA
ncbi:phage related protein [Bartonella kosoyi]|uniref:Phage related protein n=1 Tax=Bartonella kosoyi TaxID=2133959 RepID=A0A5B9CWN1_9HYPH|nr:hypothetical protein [Bartonella kosoyi]QEE08866.1 phage related protein [Bartonella kosoyi]